MNTKTKSPELPNMPKQPKSVLRATEVVEALEIVDDKKQTLDSRKAALVSQMKADNIRDVKCQSADGRPFSFNIESLEKLNIKKPKADE